MHSYPLEFGQVSRLLQVDEATIRFVAAPSSADDDQEAAGLSVYACQGHISNRSRHPVENLRIDVSYYDEQRRFLGRDKTGLLDIDELAPGEQLPFEIDLQIPEGTARCVLNVTAKRKGLLSRFL